MSSAKLNFFDERNVALVPTSGTVLQVTPIPAGFGDQTSLAATIRAKCIDLHMALITVQQTPNGTSDMIRFAIVQDMQPNGSTPTLADLFNTTGSSPVVDHRNFDNDERFIWWHDEVIDVTVYGSLGANTIQTCRFIERSIDVSGAPRTVFQSGSTSGTSGQFFLVLASYQGITVSESITRTWYKFLGK